jgi:hypothetical protein
LRRRPPGGPWIAWIRAGIGARVLWLAVRDDGDVARRPSSAYVPKSPARGVLYQVVRDHFETFRAEAARIHERDGLPRFIEEEFRGFLWDKD